MNRPLAEDLHDLLHPMDHRDIPIPGFATGDAVIAWARERVCPELVDLLKEVLRTEPDAQQYMAMGMLRGIGVLCYFEPHGENQGSWIVGHNADVVTPQA